MGIFHHRGPVAILICVVWKKGGEPEYLCLKHAGKQWCWPMPKLEDRERAEGLSSRFLSVALTAFLLWLLSFAALVEVLAAVGNLLRTPAFHQAMHAVMVARVAVVHVGVGRRRQARRRQAPH